MAARIFLGESELNLQSNIDDLFSAISRSRWPMKTVKHPPNSKRPGYRHWPCLGSDPEGGPVFLGCGLYERAAFPHR